MRKTKEWGLVWVSAGEAKGATHPLRNVEKAKLVFYVEAEKYGIPVDV